MITFKTNRKLYALFLSLVLSFVLITQANAQVSVQEYCSTLSSITQNNEITGGAAAGAESGYEDAGCGNLGYTYIYIFDQIVISHVFE